MKERVQKLMANANVGSRRASEQLIEQGRVRVNGQVITLGDKADPDTDVIEVDGVRLRFDKLEKRYIALYKPKNVVSTSEPHESDDRKTVLDLVPHSEHLFSIGRLDADSEGLVVLTNDGDLANRLTHPSYRHTKTYLVTVQGVPSPQTLDRWQRGIELQEDDGRTIRTAPCVVHMVKKSGSVSVLRVIMTEGKKRQIRRIANALGHPVGKLVRTDIGKLSIEGLKPGEFRDLDEEEVELLSTPSPEFKISRRPAPRHRTDRRDDKPRRTSGERSARGYKPRSERTEGERPNRRPAGAYAAHSRRSESETSDRPKRAWDSDKPRRSSGERSERSYKPRGERSEGYRPRRKPDGEYAARPRRSEGETSDRPKRAWDSDKPRRSSGERSERSYKPRSERNAGDRSERSYKSRSERPAGDRPRRKPDGERSYRSRSEGDSDKPRRSSSQSSGSYKPRGERTEGDRPRRRPDGEHSTRPRREGDSDRPRRSSGERSERTYNKSSGERPEGGRPRRPAGKGGAPRAHREGDNSDRPARSSKPQGGRSGSGKPRSGGSAPRPAETRHNDEEE